MFKAFRSLLDWIGRAVTLQGVIHSQFFQTWFWPLLSAIATGLAGIAEHQSLMWVLMAAAIAFAAVTIGMVAVIALRVQTSPQNKLLSKVVFHHDLTPREAPLLGTRQQRRAKARQEHQMISSSQIVPN